MILKLFQSKIQQCIKYTPRQDRENLEPELRLKIYEKIKVLHAFSTPGFFDFIETEK